MFWCIVWLFTFCFCWPCILPYWSFKFFIRLVAKLRCRFALMVTLITAKLKMGGCLSPSNKPNRLPKHGRLHQVVVEPSKGATRKGQGPQDNSRPLNPPRTVTNQPTSSRPYEETLQYTRIAENSLNSNSRHFQNRQPVHLSLPYQSSSQSVQKGRHLDTHASLKTQQIVKTEKVKQDLPKLPPLDLYKNPELNDNKNAKQLSFVLKTENNALAKYSYPCPGQESCINPERSTATGCVEVENTEAKSLPISLDVCSSIRSVQCVNKFERNQAIPKRTDSYNHAVHKDVDVIGRNSTGNSVILSQYKQLTEEKPQNNEQNLSFEESEGMKRARNQTDKKAEDGCSNSTRPKRAKTEEDSSEKIISELKSRFKKEYSSRYDAEGHSDLWFDTRTLKENGKVSQEIVKLPALIPLEESQVKLLVFGKPKFGKTTLCRTLTYIWASQSEHESKKKREKGDVNYSSVKRFKLCYRYQLSHDNVQNIEENLIHRFCRALEIDKEVIRKALHMNMSKTLLLFDGYHKLDERHRSLLRAFLQGNAIFKDASILLTSRPDADTELCRLFPRHADICGLSPQILKEMTKTYNPSGQKLELFVSSCKVDQLYDISPHFSHFIIRAFVDENQPKSLYELLDHVFHDVVKTNSGGEMSEEKVDRLFRQLGMFLFEKLKTRQYVFKMETLKELLGKSSPIVDYLEIFILIPGESSKAVVLHRTFMLYFAVKYLRCEWDRLKMDQQKDTFLKLQFSFPDCSMERILDSKNASKSYYVGVIPDIVLEFPYRAHTSSSFQLVNDVDCPEISTAFNTRNLLLRIDEKRLNLFGLKEIKNDELQNEFADLMELFDFPNLIVQSSFYETGKSTLLTKFNAISDEKDQTVMFGVASMDKSVPHGNRDRFIEVYVDVRISDISDLSEFLQRFTDTFFKVGQLENVYTADQGPELVYDLVSLALRSREEDRHIQVTLGSNVVHDTSSLVTCDVISQEATVRYSSRSGKDEEYKLVMTSASLVKNKDKLMRKMKSRSEDKPGLCVTVCVKSRRLLR